MIVRTAGNDAKYFGAEKKFRAMHLSNMWQGVPTAVLNLHLPPSMPHGPSPDSGG